MTAEIEKAKNKASAAPNAERLSEIEGAIHLAMSPSLLRYFTKNPVKSGDDRKLSCIEIDGLNWYEKKELDSYDKYLRQPWPKSPKAQRPHLPDKIKQEIKLEAECGCAICNFQAAGEAAHIEPVAQTLSHHPSNLLWLCANHHAILDEVARPSNVSAKTVAAVKQNLVDRRIRLWSLEHAVSKPLLRLIQLVEHATAMLMNADLSDAHVAVKALAEIDLKHLHDEAFKITAAGATSDQGSKSYVNLAEKVSKSSKAESAPEPQALVLLSQSLAKAKTDYLDETGQVECPLCHASGTHNGEECPVCVGEGFTDKDVAEAVDVSEYELVTCPICKGDGGHNNEQCPVCAGDGELERRFYDQLDARDFGSVRCPLCKGDRKWNGEDCPACHAEGEMERRFAEQIDLRDYNMVNCSLCKGAGQYNNHDCPACGGAGEMAQHIWEGVDWSDFEEVKCPKCDGHGQVENYDCAVCSGEGKIFRSILAQLD